MIDLRYYQKEAIEAPFQWWDENMAGDPLIVLPTGTGKSVVVPGMAKRAIETGCRGKILVLTHQKELIEQNYAQTMRFWPGASASIYSASLGKKCMKGQIIFAGIQSIYKRAFDLGRVSIVMIDEAHLIPPADKSMARYSKFLTDLRVCSPKFLKVGLTATPYRLDSGLLYGGKESLFGGIAYEKSVAEMVAEGFLVPPVSARTMAQINTDGVRMVAGDFNISQLEQVAMDEATVTKCINEAVDLGRDRRSWIVFGVTIKHCEMMAEALRSRGVSCLVVSGEMNKGDRERALAEFKAGRVRCLLSVGVLTTGFDAPATDFVVLVRPTKSPGLYVQMVGRGLRLSPGKGDCLVADFGGNVIRHGPIDAIDVGRKGKALGMDAPKKKCPQCESKVFIQAKVCPGCGFEFEVAKRESKVTTVAGGGMILTSAEPIPFPVTDVQFRLRHGKETGRPYVAVVYQCGLGNQITDFLHMDGSGWARRQAIAIWEEMGGGMNPPPKDSESAMERVKELTRLPGGVTALRDGKYWKIVGRTYREHKEEV